MSLKRIYQAGLFIIVMIHIVNSDVEGNYTSFNYLIRNLIEPLSYDIIIKIPLEADNQPQATFYGVTRDLIIIEQPLRVIDFNSYRIAIRKNITQLQRLPFHGNIYVPENQIHSDDNQTLRMVFKTEIPCGFYHIYMEFNGDINEEQIGLYKTGYVDNGIKKWIYATQLRPIAARRVFPCWDTLEQKARFGIEIRHSQSYKAISNMPVQTSILKKNMTRTTFHSTPWMSTYLVAFLLSDFDCSYSTEMLDRNRGESVCYRAIVNPTEIIFALESAYIIATYFRNYTLMYNQFLYMTHVILPHFSYEATENWGLNFYREDNLLYNSTLDSIYRQFDVSMCVASMITHQWFNNLVSPASSSYLWFTQTLAIFYAAKISIQMYKHEERVISILFNFRLQSFAREDYIVSRNFTHENINSDSAIHGLFKLNLFSSYAKEYAIMIMLENALTEEVFRRGTIEYLHKHKFSLTTPHDFWSSIQNARYENTHIDKYIDIKMVMDSWSMLYNVPVLEIIRDNVNSSIPDAEYLNIQHRYLPIPIRYIGNLDLQEDKNHTLWLESENITIPVDKSGWIIANPRYVGYYRVLYDLVSWQNLAKFLRYGNFKELDVLTRVHIIDDAYYFWSKNQLHIGLFHELIGYMINERQCVVWYAMQKIFQKMWNFLNLDVGATTKIKILDILNSLLDKTGFIDSYKDNQNIKLMRLLAIKWACRFGHKNCLQNAKDKLYRHLYSPEIMLSPVLEEWTFCNGLMSADFSIWIKVWQKYKEKKEKIFLEYLTCSEDISIIIKYLEIITWNNILLLTELDLTMQDRYKIYFIILKKHAGKYEVSNYISKNLERIKTIGMSFIDTFEYIIENVYSIKQLEKITSVINDIDDDNETLTILNNRIQVQYSVIQDLIKLAD